MGRAGLTSRAEITNRYLEEVSKSKASVALFTSAAASEVAEEGKQWGDGHGVFTHFLLQGMRGEADGYGAPKDGIVSVGELFEYVRDRVKQETKNRQHPTIGATPFDPTLPMAVTGDVNAEEHFQIGCGLALLGWLLDDATRFQAAGRQFGEALRLYGLLKTSAPQVALKLGQALFAAQDVAGSIEVLTSLVRRKRPKALAEALLTLGMAHVKQQQPGAAIAVFASLLAEHPQYEDAGWVSQYGAWLKSKRDGRKRALLIGINRYCLDTTFQLQGCVNDVRLMHQALRQHGFAAADIITLLDEAATRQGILNALQTLAQQARPADIVVINYSGHSVPDVQRDVFGSELPTALYLIVHDTRNEAGEITNGITNTELHASLKAIESEQTLLVLDTHPNFIFNRLAEREGDYIVLLASDSAEIAYEVMVEIDGKAQQAGIFTRALTTQLAHLNSAWSTYGDLLDATLRETARLVQVHALAHEQTPLLIGDRQLRLFEHKDNYAKLFDFAQRRSYSALTAEAIANRYAQVQAKLGPPFPRLHASFGRAFLEKGNNAAAVEALQTALHQANNRFAEAALALGKAQLHLRRYAEALLSFRQFAADVPDLSAVQTLVDQTNKLMNGKRHALLVGINQYLNPDIVPVRGAINDVAALSAVLTIQYGFATASVTVLRDHAATRSAILDQFKRLVAVAQEEAAFFYFAGHGSTDRSGLTIVSADGRQDGVYDIALQELVNLAANTPNLVAIFDAGWTSSLTGKRADRTVPDDKRERPVTRDITVPRELTEIKLQIGGLTLYSPSITRTMRSSGSELENELPDPQGGRQHAVYGKLTHALVQRLWAADSATFTWQQWLAPDTPAFVVGNGLDEPVFHNRTLAAATLRLLQSLEQAPLHALIELLRRFVEERQQQGDNCPEGRLNLGLAYAAIGDYDQGLTYLDRAVALYSDPSIMQREVEKDPTAGARLPEAHYHYGRVLFQSQRNFTEAKTQLEEALRLDPENARTYYYLGQAIREIVERETLSKAETALQTYLARGAPLGHEDEVRQFLGSRLKPNLSGQAAAEPTATR